MTEADIQREAVAILRGMGYLVWVTSTNRKSRCTPGTPDVFVAIGNGRALCLEFKRPVGSKLSEEQKAQDMLGLVFTVRSSQEAVKAVRSKK